MPLKNLFARLAFLIVLIPAAAQSFDRRDAEIREALARFDRDPRTFMNETPARLDSRGRWVPGRGILPPPRGFTTVRGQMRDRVRAQGIYRHSRAGANDDPARLVDHMQFFDLATIERSGLTAARVPSQPWSGPYWPLAEGMLAQRFADPQFPFSFNWKQNADYILSHLNNSSSVEQLSPAEKYDLLVGDANWSLTRQSLAQGEQYWRAHGSVEGWMGICHGWAPASYMTSRPARSITALGVNGVKIPFYPSDLKGLASLLWANGVFRTKSIGTRCDESAPRTDENGRITESSCLDENPASWHLSIVNQVGASKRSLVLDATYDYQVWNQPAIAYTYTLFNPETQAPAASLAEAEVRIADFRSDKFGRYRSRDTAYVVGIAMDLTYGSETGPSTQNTDGPEDDAQANVRYLYDLELDSAHRIIGGEWYQNAHPDFLWTPARNARALSIGDSEIDRGGPAGWNGSDPFPKAWTGPAVRASRYGQPLAHAVESLLILSAAGIR